MKFVTLFAVVALAQCKTSLDKKIKKAVKKCSVYMEKAMVCEPAAGNIGKYGYLLQKVITSSDRVWINTNI